MSGKAMLTMNRSRTARKTAIARTPNAFQGDLPSGKLGRAQHASHQPAQCGSRCEPAGERQEGVQTADDLDRATAIVGAERRLDHPPRVQVREETLSVVAAGNVGKLGTAEAGRDRGNAHTAAAYLLGQRLGEAEH